MIFFEDLQEIAILLLYRKWRDKKNKIFYLRFKFKAEEFRKNLENKTDIPFK